MNLLQINRLFQFGFLATFQTFLFQSSFPTVSSNPLSTCVPYDPKPCKINIAIFTCSSESDEYVTTFKQPYDFKHHLQRTISFLKILVLSTTHFPIHSIRGQQYTFLDVFIFSNKDEEDFDPVWQEIKGWDEAYRNSFSLTLERVKWTAGFEWMKDIYAPCVTYKFLLSEALPNVDSIIYLDTDILFGSNPRQLWDFFGNFSAGNEFALDQRFLDDDTVNPFNTQKVRALDGVLGQKSELNFNSGVVLWNLTRIRENGLLQPWIKSLQTYKSHLFSDDMMIRSYILKYEDIPRFRLPCSWNYRIGFCDLKSDQIPINLFHGMRGRFYNDGFPKCYYDAFATSNLTNISNDVTHLQKSTKLCFETCSMQSDPQSLYICQSLYHKLSDVSKSRDWDKVEL